MDYLKISEEVFNGDRSALEAYAMLKNEESKLKLALEAIGESARDEAAQYGGKTFETKGYKYELRNGRASYSFKHIPEWEKKNKELKELESQYKSAFSTRSKNLNTITEDGEEIPLPEVTYSKDSLIVKKIN